MVLKVILCPRCGQIMVHIPDEIVSEVFGYVTELHEEDGHGYCECHVDDSEVSKYVQNRC